MSGRAADQDLRIPPDEFEQIRKTSKMHSRNLDVAYELLVEGKGLVAVATAHGLTKQRALAIRDKIYSAYLMKTPEGWKCAQICAPSDMIDRFIKEADSERLRYWHLHSVASKEAKP
ncbi:ParR [Pseudomonas gingeri NCPPB 3146 = LMG 5327]|uniref:Transcriptional regulator n=2 Tax=Pseudomonas gingeri TaxID=117681 RepID=A0A7Y7Y6T6_9PSED|nr:MULTISPECIES: TrfB-related DNA-binding protein [Pseudomonas]NNA18744.1 ParR [Pseudomonas lundensis]NWC18696.1 transcriptional regulator [Pseudomonas gingeri]PNQ93399.1 ParR [Pseudomonas gingeri NCPPB 3146 = LMG 5327]